jgi:hypothetical protein
VTDDDRTDTPPTTHLTMPSTDTDPTDASSADPSAEWRRFWRREARSNAHGPGGG